MIEYAVRAIFPDQSFVQPYLDWLVDGHINDVLGGGAVSGYAIIESDLPENHAVVSRYLFPSRDAFDQYERETAPRLRKEGSEKFGPHTGIVMSRTLGTVIEPK